MIIGIIGKKRSGKDTCGDYLTQNGFVKYSFANPLKKGAMELFGFTADEVFGDAKDNIHPEWGVTPRLVLQILGTELFQFDLPKHIPEFKKIGRNFWVKRFKMWYEEQQLINPELNVVICDVRFQHEVDAILHMGGKLIKIYRPDIVSNDEHDSEKEMDKIEGQMFHLTNDGTIDELYLKLDNILLNNF